MQHAYLELRLLARRLLPDGIPDFDRVNELSTEEVDRLRTAMSDEMLTNGVDLETGALNEYGRRIDGLIDLLPVS